MPIFDYKGLAKSGKNVKGVVDADNIRAARLKLKKEGVFVTDLKDRKRAANKKKKTSTRGGVPLRDLALMIRQLATLVKANIQLVDALAIISEQVEHPALKESLADCKNMVNEGSTLNKALAKYPNIYSNIFISMIEAGEASGSLDSILMRLAEFSESAADLRAKLSSAMTYPIILLIIVLGILFGLFTVVIPKITVIFDANPQLTLPWYTQVVMDISGFMVNYWYFILGTIGIAVYGFLSWKKSPKGSEKWDAISLKIPLFGPIIRMVAIARFTRTLSTLLTGGVPMLMAMDIVKNVVNNHVICEAIDEARSNISEGESISGPLKRSGQFPSIVIDMVSIGEKTGELESMLTQVSDAYDFQVKAKIEAMTSLVTPLVTVIMGIVVFIIVISIMMPMFEMTDIAN